jgi:hypothetical protein
MAWNDLLLGALLTAGGGVVTTSAAAWLGNRRDRRRYRHERVMAQDERRQRRLQDTYLELLVYLSYQRRQVKSIRPTSGSSEPPVQIDPNRLIEMDAKVAAFGSPRVQQLLDGWGDWADRIQEASWTIHNALSGQNLSKDDREDAAQEKRKLPDYMRAMFDAENQIRAQVHAELLGSHDGPAEPA